VALDPSLQPKRDARDRAPAERIVLGHVKGSGPATRHDAAALALAAVVGIASRVVEPRGPREPLTLGGRPLPSMCLIHHLTGHRCPSCGLTRGVIYMARLEVRNALRANWLAPFVALSIVGRVAVAVYRCSRSGRGDRGRETVDLQDFP
jgi:uncharacterized protein DUF2752